MSEVIDLPLTEGAGASSFAESIQASTFDAFQGVPGSPGIGGILSGFVCGGVQFDTPDNVKGPDGFLKGTPGVYDAVEPTDISINILIKSTAAANQAGNFNGVAIGKAHDEPPAPGVGGNNFGGLSIGLVNSFWDYGATNGIAFLGQFTSFGGLYFGAGTFSFDHWHMMSLVFNSATGEADLYIDSSIMQSSFIGPDTIDWGTHGHWRVGDGEASYAFFGNTNPQWQDYKIRACRVWDNPLSSGDVAALYAFYFVTPVATAGISPIAFVGGDTVQLSGSASGGDGFTYAWSQTAGPAVTLSDPSAQNPTFVAPSVAVPTDITFQLIVTNCVDLTSAPVTVTGTAMPPPPPPPLPTGGSVPTTAASPAPVDFGEDFGF